MAAKRKTDSDSEKIQTGTLPDVLTVSEHSQLSDDDKQAFRLRLGTVTTDPQ